MTVDVPLSAPGRIEASVEAAIARLHAERDRWDREEFASQAAAELMQMRPPADAGERAAGIAAGLEMAVRVLLRLAGVPAVPETEETSPHDH